MYAQGSTVGVRNSKVTVLLDDDEFARLDQFCEAKGFKKSTLISRLIRQHLDRAGFPSQSPLPFPEAPARRSRSPADVAK